jgi:hypothetical protein
MLGVLPSGILIASGCTLYLYTRYNYGSQAPAFENFTKLRQHLVSNSSPKQRSYVIVEGTVRKVSENNDTEGGSKTSKVDTDSELISALSDITVPFLLVDTNGESLTVATVKSAQKIKLAIENKQKEATVLNLKQSSSGQASQSGPLPPTDTRLGLYGLASIENNKVVIYPSAADVSMAAIVASQKSRRRKLYAGSCFLVLSGGALFVIGVVLPIFRVYKLLRALLALIGI